MKHIVTTASGRLLELDATERDTTTGLVVTVVAFDEEGWDSRRGKWRRDRPDPGRDGSPSLAEVVERTGGASQEEAEQVAERFLAAWPTRREDLPPGPSKAVSWVLAILALAAIGVLTLIVGLIWLVVT